MIRRAFRREEGAGTTEFALLTMLLVPMVVYVIYAGEAITTSMKAAEAEISAGWDITAYRTHAYSGGSASSLLNAAASKTKGEVDDALADLDSYADTGRTGYRGVFGFTTVDGLECTARSSSNNGGNYGPVTGKSYLHSDGWVACTTQTQFENKKAPKNAHREFYRSKPKILESAIEKLTIAGLGQSFKGCDNNCTKDGKRGFLVLTDDYGLEDPNPTEVQQFGSGNRKYYNVGNKIWSNTGGGAGAAIVTGVTGFLIGLTDQGQTGRFKMGYMRTIDTKRNFGNHGGGMQLHLSPDHETENRATKQTRDLSTEAYNNKRYQDHYLGMRDKNWNGQ